MSGSLGSFLGFLGGSHSVPWDSCGSPGRPQSVLKLHEKAEHFFACGFFSTHSSVLMSARPHSGVANMELKSIKISRTSSGNRAWNSSWASFHISFDSNQRVPFSGPGRGWCGQGASMERN